jgi:hypothetical protein
MRRRPGKRVILRQVAQSALTRLKCLFAIPAPVVELKTRLAARHLGLSIVKKNRRRPSAPKTLAAIGTAKPSNHPVQYDVNYIAESTIACGFRRTI